MEEILLLVRKYFNDDDIDFDYLLEADLLLDWEGIEELAALMFSAGVTDVPPGEPGWLPDHLETLGDLAEYLVNPKNKISD